jgi:ATP-dependent helicase Lhr and Lhr-like helicase
LPARLSGYQPSWLDALCLAGRVTWRRLRAGNAASGGARRPSPIRSTPITLLPRRNAAAWAGRLATPASEGLSACAAAVADFIRQHGASFFSEIVATTGLLRCQVEDAISELVALGLLNSDGFSGLRALLAPPAQRRPLARANRRQGAPAAAMEVAGRWALTSRPASPQGDGVEHVAGVLLRRYGIVFWRLIEREAPRLPPWRDLLRVYRKLESRGDVRGGRFVAGFSGEQFALPEALGALRDIRHRQSGGSLVSVSAADPLNLVGILTPGPRLPALTGNRLLYRDGLPIALLAGGEVAYLETLKGGSEWEARNALLRSAKQAPFVLRGAA